jgi:hypothetical protein
MEHESLSDSTIQAIVDELKKDLLLENIIKPLVTASDVKSVFKCLPRQTASSPSGRGLHHYKACAEVFYDGLSGSMCEVYADMMTTPL